MCGHFSKIALLPVVAVHVFLSAAPNIALFQIHQHLLFVVNLSVRFLDYVCINSLSFRLLSKNLKIKLCKTIILSVVLYGCETWSLTLREEFRLRVFENRILRRIFGPKRDENGKWRRLHNEKLHSLYRSPNIVRVIKCRRLRWAGHVARMEEYRKDTFGEA